MTRPIPRPRTYASWAAVCPICTKRLRGHSEKAAVTNYERHYIVEHVP